MSEFFCLDERNSLVFKYMQGARKVTKKIPSKKYY